MKFLKLKNDIPEERSIESAMWLIESQLTKMERKLEFLKRSDIGPDERDLDRWEIYSELANAYKILEEKLQTRTGE